MSALTGSLKLVQNFLQTKMRLIFQVWCIIHSIYQSHFQFILIKILVGIYQRKSMTELKFSILVNTRCLKKNCFYKLANASYCNFHGTDTRSCQHNIILKLFVFALCSSFTLRSIISLQLLQLDQKEIISGRWKPNL